MSGIVDRFDAFLAISRRGYPIMGRPNLRLFDATGRPLKPVYLKYEILEVGLEASEDQSQDQSRDQSQDQIQDQSRDPDPRYLRS